jgi:hypothetical protein
MIFNPITRSNSNSLANQLSIHLILAKQEKLASNSLAKIEFGKTHLQGTWLLSVFPYGWEGEKKNREGILM